MSSSYDDQKYENSHMDEPLHAFRFEIERFEKSEKSSERGGLLSNSPLYKNLPKTIQAQIDSDSDGGLEVLKHAYEYDFFNKTFADDVKSVFGKVHWSFELNIALDRSERVIDALEYGNIDNFSNITLQEGAMPILMIVMYLTMKRYHRRFNLPNFLPCYLHSENRETVNLKSLKKNLVFSRWHFLLTGSYLPVVAFYSGDGHATNTLFVPGVGDRRDSPSSSSSSSFIWHIIHINPNGGDFAYTNRFRDDPDEVIRSYQKYIDITKGETENIGVKRSNCSSNIQKNYGTCAVWCMMLTMLMLSRYQMFQYQSKPLIDFVNLYCFGLSRKTTNAKVIDQFHEYIGDFVVSFRFMTFDILQRLQRTDKFDVDSFINEILRGSVHKTVELDVRIFQAAQSAMSHFDRYAKRKLSKKLVLDFLEMEKDNILDMISQLKKPKPSYQQTNIVADDAQIAKLQSMSQDIRDMYRRVLTSGASGGDDDDSRYDGAPEEQSDDESEQEKKQRKTSYMSKSKWATAIRHIRQLSENEKYTGEEGEEQISDRKRKPDKHLLPIGGQSPHRKL